MLLEAKAENTPCESTIAEFDVVCVPSKIPKGIEVNTTGQMHDVGIMVL